MSCSAVQGTVRECLGVGRSWTAPPTTARQIFFAGTVETFQVIIPDFGIVEGPFQITAIEYAGSYNGEATTSAARLGRRADLHGDLMVNWPARPAEARRQAPRRRADARLAGGIRGRAKMGTLMELVERLAAGPRRADADRRRGLRGGGWEGTADDLSRVEIGGGPVEAARGSPPSRSAGVHGARGRMSGLDSRRG